MSRVFVDTSALVALAFRQTGHQWLAEHLASAEDRFAAPLLEAGFRATLGREEVEGGIELLGAFRWVLPDRPLSPELDRVFGAGYARGADAWHLASALFLVESPGDLPFLTLDRPQGDIARALPPAPGCAPEPPHG